MLRGYLKENDSLGEPIFTSDIDIPGMTEESLRYHLKKLTDESIICRFEPGVCYFPKSSILGERMSLSTDAAALHKYIMRRGKRIGYDSGYEKRISLKTRARFSADAFCA